jgi:hypothetical protein
MKQIIDPGHHWHKDQMPDEEPRPGITEPNYDEHSTDFDERMEEKYAWDPGDPQDYPGWEDVPF